MTSALLRCIGSLLLPILYLGLLLPASPAKAQHWLHDDGSETYRSMFRQVEDWPDPTPFRNAAGSPGPGYWQQQVDYVIEAVLDTTNHTVTGSERITYHNNSPDELAYLWVQLDQNIRSREHSRCYQTREALPEKVSQAFLKYVGSGTFDGSYTLDRVQIVEDGRLVEADYRINNTIMKVKVPEPLNPGGTQELEIDWSYPVPDQARGAKEKVTDGWFYEMAQWFPRMSVYDVVNGWQTDQFLGQGEFYLNFGNYDVKMTVPGITSWMHPASFRILRWS